MPRDKGRHIPDMISCRQIAWQPHGIVSRPRRMQNMLTQIVQWEWRHDRYRPIAFESSRANILLNRPQCCLTERCLSHERRLLLGGHLGPVQTNHANWFDTKSEDRKKSQSRSSGPTVGWHIGYHDLFGFFIPEVVDSQTPLRVACVSSTFHMPVGGKSSAAPVQIELIGSAMGVSHALLDSGIR